MLRQYMQIKVKPQNNDPPPMNDDIRIINVVLDFFGSEGGGVVDELVAAGVVDELDVGAGVVVGLEVVRDVLEDGGVL